MSCLRITFWLQEVENGVQLLGLHISGAGHVCTGPLVERHVGRSKECIFGDLNCQMRDVLN